MDTIDQHKVVVIAGPTATGKSRLSVELATALGGEIISADSMQVYRGMDIGTAKPAFEQQKGIPHYLLDVVDPEEKFNAAIYRSMALPLVTDIGMREKLCFVVGGTGLYIKGLLDGLFQCPPADLELRESLQNECEIYGSVRLHERLKQLDPEVSHKIHPNDKVRITRALEIIHLTKKRPSDLSRRHGFGNRAFNALKFCLEIERKQLYDRINERSMTMVETGLVEETETLLSKGYSPCLKPMKAIGYRHMVKYLKGDWSLSEAISNLQRDTRRYAKRQLTWFRADLEFSWVSPEDFNLILDKIKGFQIRTA